MECVVVCQSSLDVELWVNGAVQSELDSRGFTFHSLTDYDLQLVEVTKYRPSWGVEKVIDKMMSPIPLPNLLPVTIRCAVNMETWYSSL